MTHGLRDRGSSLSDVIGSLDTIGTVMPLC